MGHRSNKKFIESLIFLIIVVFIVVSFFSMEGSFVTTRERVEEINEPLNDPSQVNSILKHELKNKFSAADMKARYADFQQSFR